MAAGWIPCVLICPDGRPIRSTAISCMWFSWRVVATPTPAWEDNAGVGAGGVTYGAGQYQLEIEILVL